MKRIALISMLVIYAASSFGIGTKQFYCCGKLTSASLTFVTQQASEGNNCCKTTFQSFKVKDSHVYADQVTVPAKYFTDVAVENNSFELVEFNSGLHLSANTIHGPPFWKTIPLYIFNSVYRI